QFVNKLEEIKEKKEVFAECGVRLSKILDFAAGVPATVGGGVRINFGALQKEVSQFVRQVTVFKPQTQTVEILSTADCGYRYRNSLIKENGWVVLSALFQKPETYEVLEV